MNDNEATVAKGLGSNPATTATLDFYLAKKGKFLFINIEKHCK